MQHKESFSQSAATCLFIKFAKTSGRATRKEFSSFFLYKILSVISSCLIISALDLIVFGGIRDGGIFFAIGLYFFIYIIPSISLSIRRLHDIGHSGWYILIVVFPWLVSFSLAYNNVADIYVRGLVSMIAYCCHVLFLIKMLITNSDGDNIYGECNVKSISSFELKSNECQNDKDQEIKVENVEL